MEVLVQHEPAGRRFVASIGTNDDEQAKRNRRQVVAEAELVLEEEGRAEAAQLALADDGLSIGQQIGFVHEVRRQQNHLDPTGQSTD